MTMFDLTGKVAVITGSSRGIGRAIAERMAGHGARVVISSRKREACEPVAQGIRERGGEAIVQPCHVGKKEELQALVDATLAAWGSIDILVCNAAVNPFYGPMAELTDEAYDRVMHTNVKSVFWLANMALPHMAASGGGSVIIISSVGGFQGQDRLGAYALSKAAEMQLARNLAVEWGPRNIRVNCLAPSVIRTDFARALWENPDTPAYQASIQGPLGRIGEPDEVAGPAVFLASQAASFITGQSLVIDGGRLIGRVTPEITSATPPS